MQPETAPEARKVKARSIHSVCEDTIAPIIEKKANVAPIIIITKPMMLSAFPTALFCVSKSPMVFSFRSYHMAVEERLAK